MVLPPFKKEKTQKLVSTIILALGFFILLTNFKLTLFGGVITIDMIPGIILSLFGFVYLFDVI